MAIMTCLKISMKKKYDKTSKVNYLSVGKMKKEIKVSREKLGMLMP